jgi:ring-1,2-phenylacetyl-CoA epoxidase subunit PaaC
VTGSITIAESPLVRVVLARADDALILGHRVSEWCGHAPILEEDIALANLALDLIGQARSLYALAAEAEGAGRDEDQFAYLRDERAYRNLLLVEQPNGDFAVTIVRHLLFSLFIDAWWRAAAKHAEARLAAIAAKAEKESAYHVRHAAEWLIRLGDGTAESHARAQAALDLLWPYTGEMFETDASGVGPDPAGIRDGWDAALADILAQATLTRPRDGWMQSGGRAGRHSEHLGPLLAELQYLQRVHPGASW